MRNWDHIVDNFIRICETRGLSESVILGRRRELERFGAWLKRRKPKPTVEGITSDLILDYIKGRTAFHSKASVCGVMSHIRCLGEYLVNEGIWNQNPLRWIQSPKIDPRRQLPKRVEKENLQRLVAQTTKMPHAHNRSLYFTLILVLYGTGIRRGELERLNLEDWDRENRTLRIDSRKVNLQRVVPVPGPVAAALESYLPVRQNTLLQLGIREERAFFITTKGKRIMGDRLGAAILTLVRKTGPEGMLETA
jgi:site-specific recombinase XerD